MDNISPRPWFYIANKTQVYDDNNVLVAFDLDEHDTQLIVKCVNEHDKLVAEVSKLNKDFFLQGKMLEKSVAEISHLEKINGSLEVEVEQLSESVKLLSDEYTKRLEVEEKVKQLKDALKKCDPWTLEVEYECKECCQEVGDLICKFCECRLEEGHKEDCQYIKLTKEE